MEEFKQKAAIKKRQDHFLDLLSQFCDRKKAEPAAYLPMSVLAFEDMFDIPIMTGEIGGILNIGSHVFAYWMNGRCYSMDKADVDKITFCK